jgi:hypothetical protein
MAALPGRRKRLHASVRMRVPVVQIRKMRMAMHQRNVTMHVHVRFSWRVIRPMGMLVVLVMHMGVLMHHLFMCVLVLMVLNKMEPQACAQ